MLRILLLHLLVLSVCHAKFPPEWTLETFRDKAEAGDLMSQFYLGEMYELGHSVSKNYVSAFMWYEKAAENGYSPAQDKLGYFYSSGIGVPRQDLKAAEIWYMKAAEAGNANAQKVIKYEEVQLARAKAGDPEGQRRIAKFYAQYRDFDKESLKFTISPEKTKEALRWYHSAVSNGSMDAATELGRIYHSGELVPRDILKAVELYTVAAENGIIEAMFQLSLLNAFGIGMAKDPIESAAWWGAKVALDVRYTSAPPQSESLALRTEPLSAEDILSVQQRTKAILKLISENRRKKNNRALGDLNKKLDDTQSPKSFGTGTIVSPKGHVLTAAHVVSGAKKITIVTLEGKAHDASIASIDEYNDIAVVKIAEELLFQWLPIKHSRSVRLGQTVATIGYPQIELQGKSPKVTKGEISSLNGLSDDPRSWQISVPVQSGNSGGPLLDEDGRMIGVILSKLGLKAARATGDIPQNVNYAVKISYALPLLEQYLDEELLIQKADNKKQSFENMIYNAQKSVVLIYVY